MNSIFSDKKPVGSSAIDKIVESNIEAADKVVSGNEVTTDKLLGKSDSVAEALRLHNEEIKQIEERRFRQQKKLSFIGISLNLLTLLILLAFTVAFFKYAIIVRIGPINP
ncbi:MAG TPA: hypothetical protein VNX68_02065 [Nitrosopumilaceae archaeon]|jgi:hypothetical protein|nr:hypothetical protein [Nitrosopumilaceae archaeon]